MPRRWTSSTSEPSKIFASLSVRNYKLYFWGQSVSVAGTWIQNVALGWLVLEISHSGTALGVVTAIRFIPTLLIGPYGGLLADRLDRRRLMLATQTLSGLLSGGYALIVACHVATLPVVYVLALALGLVNVVANPVRQTLVNDLVPRELLPNAVALNSISTNVARVVGPLFAGLLIAWIGVAPCFAINAASFVAVLISLTAMRTAELFPSPSARRARGQLREGFGYVLHTPEILVPMTMIAVIGTFAWEFQVTLPLVATSTFGGGAGTYGAMLSGLGVGATAAGLWIARTANTTVRAAAVSALVLGLAMLVAAIAPNIYLEVAVLVVVGWCTISFSVRAKSVLQLSSLPHMRGRVMSVWVMAWQGTTPLGGPIVGWLGQHAGARWSLVGGGVPAIVAGLYGLIYGWYLASRHPASYRGIPDQRSELAEPGPIALDAREEADR